MTDDRVAEGIDRSEPTAGGEWQAREVVGKWSITNRCFGEKERGLMGDYVDGLRSARMTQVDHVPE
jgi:hypothetical protein